MSAVLVVALSFVVVGLVRSGPADSNALPNDQEESVAESQPTAASSQPPDAGGREPDLGPSISARALSPVSDDSRLVSQAALSGPSLALLAEGAWVPQVSAKCIGLPATVLLDSAGTPGIPDGTLEQKPAGLTEQDIVDFQRALASQIRADLLVFRVPGGETGPCAGQTIWVSIANMPFPTMEQAQSQCDAWGLPDSECDPLQVTAEIIEHGRYRPQLVSSGEVSFAIDVPVAMDQDGQSGGAATFSDRSTGSELTMELLDPGDTIPGLLDAEEQLRRSGVQITLSVPEDNGYRLSGVSSQGTIAYVRVYGTGGPGARLTWTYPQSQQATYGPAIEYATQWFGPMNGF